MHSRMVTPWLRTSLKSSRQPFADSGHQRGGDTVRVERKEAGRWVELPESSDLALAFAGGTRAVVDGRLYRESGPPVELPCKGKLRAAPGGAELLCIESFARFSTDGPPQTLIVTRIDADGGVLSRRALPWPVRLQDTEPPIGRMLSVDFLGFVPEGLVFSVFEAAPHASFADDAPQTARAFLLGPDDQWSELGTLHFITAHMWKLHFPQPWNKALGRDVDPGAWPRDSAGEPDPAKHYKHL